MPRLFRSLRFQFMLVLSIPALLIMISGIISYSYSRIFSSSTQKLASERMVFLEQVQGLVQSTLLIERETDRMMMSDTTESLQQSYHKILDQLTVVNARVLDIGTGLNDGSILALNQASQLLQNTVHINAQLRKALLTRSPAPAEYRHQQELMTRYKKELEHQVTALVLATENYSHRFTTDHIQAMQHLTATFAKHERIELGILVAGILLAWWGVWFFWGRRVARRLQLISHYLRMGKKDSGLHTVPVTGNDELAHMARAVDQFLADRRLLIQTQEESKQHIEELKKAFEEIKILKGILPICSSCKKIRDDKGYWNQLESYIEAHSDTAFSHSLCPECSDKLYGNQSWYIKMKKKERH